MTETHEKIVKRKHGDRLLEVKDLLLELCSTNSIKDALEIAGIPKTTYDYWVHRDNRKKEPYATFYREMKRAKALRRSRLVDKIENARDWKAWSWLLGKLDPLQYGDDGLETNEAMKFMWECVCDVVDGEQAARIIELMNERREIDR